MDKLKHKITDYGCYLYTGVQVIRDVIGCVPATLGDMRAKKKG